MCHVPALDCELVVYIDYIVTMMSLLMSRLRDE